MRPRAIAWLAAATCGAAVLVSCSGEPGAAPEDGSPAATSSATEAAAPGPGEYLPGRTATVDLVDDPRAVVVIVPGGAWTQIWDPPGFRPLAETFVGADLSVVQVTYSTAETQSYFPRPADDVACAVAYAAEQVPGVPVVLVGHSAGAVLVVLTGLVPGRDDPECPYPPHAADGVVGLAGPYDIPRSGIGENLFGVRESEDPELWRDGDPHSWAAERPEVPFLLAHGEADSIPLGFTQGMADALTDGGHPVTVEVLPGREHNDMYRADVVGDLVVGWIEDAVLAPGS